MKLKKKKAVLLTVFHLEKEKVSSHEDGVSNKHNLANKH